MFHASIAPDLVDCPVQNNHLAVQVLESTEPEIAMFEQNAGTDGARVGTSYQSSRSRDLVHAMALRVEIFAQRFADNSVQ